MAQKIFVGDIGTEIRVVVTDDDVAVDISSATVIQIIFKKPSGDELTIDANLYTDGSDGTIYYNTVDGDIDEPGLWKIQAYIELGGGSFYSSISSFKVNCNL